MFNVDKTYRQNPKSQLFKVDIKPDAFNSIELSARSYQNKITRRHIDSDDFYLKYHYAPFSELIDFNLTASTSRGEQKFMSDNMAGFSDSTAKTSPMRWISTTPAVSACGTSISPSATAASWCATSIRKRPLAW